METLPVTELEPKLFESLTELSNKVILVRNELADLERAKDEFIKQRDLEIQERIKHIYDVAKNTLLEAESCGNTIKSYLKIIDFLITEVIKARQTLQENNRLFNDHKAEVEQMLDKKSRDLEVMAYELKINSEKIQSTVKELEDRDARLKKERIAIDDQKQILVSAFSEFSKKPYEPRK